MKNEIKFEEAIEKLETIVRDLEGGNLSLDESISAYEEAMGLVKVCYKRLSDCEIRVRQLTESGDGAVTDIPFVNSDEA